MSERTTASDLQANLRASRTRVARSRGAAGGLLVVILGAWAALIPFIGPYFDFAFTPQPDTSWHWTTGRGLYEVLPGGVAALGGLLLLASANRVVTSFGGWLAVAGGAWLVVSPSLAGPLGVDTGAPDPSKGETTRSLLALLYFYAIGAAIVLFAALALGRLSVHAVRDVRAAEKRAEAEVAAAEAERARVGHEAEQRRRADAERAAQAEQAAQAERAAQAEQAVRAEQAAQAERAAQAEQAAQAVRAPQAERPAAAPDDQRDYQDDRSGAHRATSSAQPTTEQSTTEQPTTTQPTTPQPTIQSTQPTTDQPFRQRPRE